MPTVTERGLTSQGALGVNVAVSAAAIAPATSTSSPIVATSSLSIVVAFTSGSAQAKQAVDAVSSIGRAKSTAGVNSIFAAAINDMRAFIFAPRDRAARSTWATAELRNDSSALRGSSSDLPPPSAGPRRTKDYSLLDVASVPTSLHPPLVLILRHGSRYPHGPYVAALPPFPPESTRPFLPPSEYTNTFNATLPRLPALFMDGYRLHPPTSASLLSPIRLPRRCIHVIKPPGTVHLSRRSNSAKRKFSLRCYRHQYPQTLRPMRGRKRELMVSLVSARGLRLAPEVLQTLETEYSKKTQISSSGYWTSEDYRKNSCAPGTSAWLRVPLMVYSTAELRRLGWIAGDTDLGDAGAVRATKHLERLRLRPCLHLASPHRCSRSPGMSPIECSHRHRSYCVPHPLSHRHNATRSTTIYSPPSFPYPPTCDTV
ncbi:hypothetical protein K438DRAFT_2032341 [Mycena galopus ATCC 62051]|nr:hypothetical protein K438DRAFT_2032341 [Mycena galopus ATCC 62051]